MKFVLQRFKDFRPLRLIKIIFPISSIFVPLDFYGGKGLRLYKLGLLQFCFLQNFILLYSGTKETTEFVQMAPSLSDIHGLLHNLGEF
jgi:hypothetical protein